ncbi:MAG TPA: isocitrate lyase/phosphoenolpyruvate mutase family protein [Burkholderiales bacterium]|nr:isocitrate lyase/phosphoenolpyruvate mutase family protein [Burkholderiales bacterium]
MPTDLLAKTRAFRALHDGPKPFLIPNPWDEGSAKLLESLGFEALATTSLGLANMLGRTGVTREEVLENTRLICEATKLPVNADLENCFADDPRAAAETIRLACEAGAAGGSIEDAVGGKSEHKAAPIYPFNLAVERVRAAVEVARALPVPFVLTARAENFLHGRPDLDDTIKRLQAFEKAGADVLYAPGRFTLEQIRTICSSVSKPVNVVMGFLDPSFTLQQVGEAGARRISIGGGLERVARQAFLDAAREMREGRFGFVARMAKMDELRKAFRG